MERCGFFNAKYNSETGIYDREYEVDDFARYFASFIGNGVFPNPSTGLQVVQADEQNMSVIVRKGQGWINGYWYENTDNWSLNVQPADGVLNRIDLVVLRYDSSSRDMYLALLTGEPAIVPIAPQIQRTEDYYDLALAQIEISAGITKVSQSIITDLRLNNEVCGLVTSLITQLDTTTWGIQLNQFIQEFIDNSNQWKSSYILDFSSRMNEFYSNKSAQFNEWFESLKSKLEGNVATNLQVQIDEMGENFGGCKFHAGDDGAYVTYEKDGEVITKKLGSSEGTATTDQVLDGATFNSKHSDEEQIGTMPNIGKVTKNLNCSSSYSIPKGYHDGTGKIIANSLASQTKATAVEQHILRDETAWVNGQKIKGTMPHIKDTQLASEIETNQDEQVVLSIPTAGYYDTGSKVAAAIGEKTNLWKYACVISVLDENYYYAGNTDLMGSELVNVPDNNNYVWVGPDCFNKTSWSSITTDAFPFSTITFKHGLDINNLLMCIVTIMPEEGAYFKSKTSSTSFVEEVILQTSGWNGKSEKELAFCHSTSADINNKDDFIISLKIDESCVRIMFKNNKYYYDTGHNLLSILKTQIKVFADFIYV